jgi:hypothetical protein
MMIASQPLQDAAMQFSLAISAGRYAKILHDKAVLGKVVAAG